MSQTDKGFVSIEGMGEVSRASFERNQRIYADIVAKYYGDPEFKKRMDDDPTRTVKEEGLEIPEYAEVKLLFSTAKLHHVVLPDLPKGS